MHRHRSHQVSHLVLRILAVANLALVSLWLFPETDHDLANGPLGGTLARFSIHSLWALPTYFCLEIVAMRKLAVERKPLVVDGSLVVVACLSILGGLLYVWTHYALL